MPNWSESMQQTYEYYIVDSGTWKDVAQLKNITKSTINRDSGAETLGSASIDITESLGECYIRIYLITIQNGITEKHPLGTFLVQTPSSSFNGKIETVTVDAYTPLLELKDNPPPLGYTVPKGENIMNMVYNLCLENARAPVVKSLNNEILRSDFVANTEDTWLSFLIDLSANARQEIILDELGRILFSPKQDTAALQPVWEYTDDNSSILLPDITLEHDMYGIPNAVEVIYSNGNDYYHYKVINDDVNSPISTVNRGREILYRDTAPALNGNPTEAQIKEYAEQLLRNLSTLEYTVTYSHGYCPVRIGDCVRLNYKRAGIDVKAKVISQNINCEAGCKVNEKAIFTTKLWR